MAFFNKILFSLLLLSVAFLTHGQDIQSEDTRKIDWQKEFAKRDFSGLWLNEDNTIVVGFCGENYERARVKLISVTKDRGTGNRYYVYGKTKVGGDVCTFRGTMVIRDIAEYNQMEYGVDDEHKDNGMKGQYRMEGDYVFYEDSTALHTGKLYGRFTTNFYIDKEGRIKYMDIDDYTDGFNNNQFEGKWVGYQSKVTKTFNWGDYRIPASRGFDIGAGEFSPDAKYLQCGWKSYADAYTHNDSAALKAEKERWW